MLNLKYFWHQKDVINIHSYFIHNNNISKFISSCTILSSCLYNFIYNILKMPQILILLTYFYPSSTIWFPSLLQGYDMLIEYIQENYRK